MEQLLDFTDKVVLVTGARSGIGKATAIAFAKQGAKVVVSGRRPCDDTQAQIAAAGGESTFIQCDVSKEEEVKNLIEQTIATYGKLDVAINNAGRGSHIAAAADHPVDIYDEIQDIDARGVYLSMYYEIPEILKQGGGAIVNIASVAGIMADPKMFGYVAAKHAVVGMTKSAGIDYAKDNLRVNAIAPGFTASEMTQRCFDNPEMLAQRVSYNFQNRAADPSEIASVALFLASDMATFINGVTIPVDGGQTAH